MKAWVTEELHKGILHWLLKQMPVESNLLMPTMWSSLQVVQQHSMYAE